MPDARRISLVAVVFVVLLRIAIGWQLTYEGLWKLDTQDSAKPWTAAGYLDNAKGPLRDTFRSLTGDPYDLSWTDYETVADRWDDWEQRFVAHYLTISDEQLAGLSENQQDELRARVERQKADLHELLDGHEIYVAQLDQLPESAKFNGSLGKAIQYNAEKKRLEVDGRWHLLPAERNRLLRMDKDNAAWTKAVRDVYARNARLGYKERAQAKLVGAPPMDEAQQRLNDIALYEHLVARYEENVDAADQAFEHRYLDRQRQELLEKKADAVGPLLALDEGLREDALDLLTTDQLARGPLPAEMNTLHFIDLATMWGLLILGVLLMVGLLSRVAAVGGAVMLFSFYLAMPPWPGVIEFHSLGTDHSLFVNKNLIEVFALLAIAAMPTGRWFGIDAWFPRFGTGRKSQSSQGDGGSGGNPPNGKPTPSTPPQNSRDKNQPAPEPAKSAT